MRKSASTRAFISSKQQQQQQKKELCVDEMDPCLSGVGRYNGGRKGDGHFLITMLKACAFDERPVTLLVVARH